MFDLGFLVTISLSIGLGLFLGCLLFKKRLDDYSELISVADQELRAKEVRIEALNRELAQSMLVVQKSSQLMEVGTERINRLVSSTEELLNEKESLEAKIKFQQTQYEKLLGQKKSSEVRTGKITEQIAPFLADYPEDPATARFLGDPIDFVHFAEDAVVFVEVKSGRSQLNKNQRRIRDLIKEGKVVFKIYRVEGDSQ